MDVVDGFFQFCLSISAFRCACEELSINVTYILDILKFFSRRTCN